MGSAYVNDFDFNNRAYRVYVQADQQFRSQPSDIRNFYVRSDTGTMIPLDNVVSITETSAPQVISHYNLFRSAEINGAAAPGIQLRPGDHSHGCGGEERPAGRVQLRMVRTFAGGNQVGKPVGDAVRPRAAAGLPDAVGAVRELLSAVHHPAERARWRCWAR